MGPSNIRDGLSPAEIRAAVAEAVASPDVKSAIETALVAYEQWDAGNADVATLDAPLSVLKEHHRRADATLADTVFAARSGDSEARARGDAAWADWQVLQPVLSLLALAPFEDFRRGLEAIADERRKQEALAIEKVRRALGTWKE